MELGYSLKPILDAMWVWGEEYQKHHAGKEDPAYCRWCEKGRSLKELSLWPYYTSCSGFYFTFTAA